MSWGDALSYVAVGNPISQAVLTSASAVLKGTVRCFVYRNYCLFFLILFSILRA